MMTPQYRRMAPGQAERVCTGKLKIQKLVDGRWVTTGFAEDLDAVRRHAEAVGGSVRVLDKKGNLVEELENLPDGIEGSLA